MFPQTLPYTNILDIPEDEFNWMLTQSLIDDKYTTCPKCNHIQSQGDFCIKCGSSLSGISYNPESYVCGDCNHYHLPDDQYCRFCGDNVGSDLYTKYQKELDSRSKTEDLADVGKDIAGSLLKMCEKVPDTWIAKLNQPYEGLMCDVYRLMDTSEELKKKMSQEIDKFRLQAEQES